KVPHLVSLARKWELFFHIEQFCGGALSQSGLMKKNELTRKPMSYLRCSRREGLYRVFKWLAFRTSNPAMTALRVPMERTSCFTSAYFAKSMATCNASLFFESSITVFRWTASLSSLRAAAGSCRASLRSDRRNIVAKHWPFCWIFLVLLRTHDPFLQT